MKRHSITEVLDVLYTMYKDFPLTELQYQTPFQLLVAVMLSAQTTDKQVNKVTETFFTTVQSPADVVAMSPEEVAAGVQGVNYAATKAKNLCALSQLLLEKTPSV